MSILDRDKLRDAKLRAIAEDYAAIIKHRQPFEDWDQLTWPIELLVDFRGRIGSNSTSVDVLSELVRRFFELHNLSPYRAVCFFHIQRFANLVRLRTHSWNFRPLLQRCKERVLPWLISDYEKVQLDNLFTLLFEQNRLPIFRDASGLLSYQAFLLAPYPLRLSVNAAFPSRLFQDITQRETTRHAPPVAEEAE